MIKLILVRHGQSTYNKQNRFTGWINAKLTEEGIKEAQQAGKILKKQNYTFDIAYTSVLKRSEDTLKYILKELGEENIKIKKTYKLNERHYGALQGLNKQKTKEKYGEEQVKLWRRSLTEKPPALTKEDKRYPGNSPKYKNLKEEELPLTESLKDTMKRVVKYYEEEITKELKSNKKVIVVAHGNSLRALVAHLDNMKEKDITNLEIPTGQPICYELDNNLKPIKHYYLK
mgnify:FL=1